MDEGMAQVGNRKWVGLRKGCGKKGNLGNEMKIVAENFVENGKHKTFASLYRSYFFA